ncbi:MAG: DEAD/DEAH box helicase, partial [Deltaproteobacteria bacterium]
MPKIVISDNNSIIIPDDLMLRLGLTSGCEVTVEEGSGNSLIISNKLTISDPTDKEPVPLEEAIARKNIQTKMQFIRGVGPKLSELLAKRGVNTVEDALYLLPHRYEDRRELRNINQLRPGFCEVFSGRVISADTVTTKGGRRFFEALVSDASGSITIKWFNSNPTFMKRLWQPGKSGIFTGEVSQYGYQREVHHPEVEWLSEGKSVQEAMAADPVNFGRIVPLYPLTEGLSQKIMRRVMKVVVDSFLPSIRELIPKSILESQHIPGLRRSLKDLHLPPADAKLDDLNSGQTLAHHAVAFDEFFFWELGLALKKRGVTLEEGIAFQVTHRYTRELARLLPFELTTAQRRVLTEIKTDMMAPHPMHRLVQGDVGSGKTLVALMSALLAVENGYQVAVMAPTEILAEQHWHTMHHWCSELGIETCLVTSGMKGKAKKEALIRVANGTANIVIGTHAVIQEKV